MAEEKLIDTCVHCGFCLPACPTYNSWNEEMDSPRGRIYLMKSINQGKAAFGDIVTQHFDKCLGCMGCVTACPSGVKYDALIEQTRAEVEDHHHRTLADRTFRGMVFSLFPYPRRLKLAVLFLLFYVNTGLRWLMHALGLNKLLPRRLRQMEALTPPVSMHQITATLPAFTPATGPKRARLALLAGCVQRVYFPGVNEATLRVLSAEGCEVVVPPPLGCCGALSVHSGRDAEARRFARAAIEILEKEQCDFIIVNAAGCGSSMKEWGRLLHDEPAFAARAATMAAKVRDINEYLATLTPVAKRNPLPIKAAYHDACHLAHAQRVRSQPRQLLAAIPNLSVSEIPDGDQCCGSAGIYNLLEPESSREIGTRKVDNVLSVAPDLIISANPGCTLQIQMLLRERGKTVRAAHPIEVLDASIRGVTI